MPSPLVCLCSTCSTTPENVNSTQLIFLSLPRNHHCTTCRIQTTIIITITASTPTLFFWMYPPAPSTRRVYLFTSRISDSRHKTRIVATLHPITLVSGRTDRPDDEMYALTRMIINWIAGPILSAVWPAHLYDLPAEFTSQQPAYRTYRPTRRVYGWREAATPSARVRLLQHPASGTRLGSSTMWSSRGAQFDGGRVLVIYYRTLFFIFLIFDQC